MSKHLNHAIQFFDFIDFFSIGIFINFRNKNKTSTLCGKMFTSVIIGYSLYTLCMNNAIQKINPIIIDQSYTPSKRPIIPLNKDDSTFIFSLVDDYYYPHLKDETIWHFEAYLYHTNVTTGEYFYEPYGVHGCTREDISLFPDLYDLYNMSFSYCLTRKDLDLFGYWDEDKVNEFGIELRTCVNSTKSNVTCKSQDVINQFISHKFFNIYLQKRNIQANNYTNPTSSAIKSYHRALNPGKTEIMYLYLREVIIDRDDDLITTAHHQIKTFINLDFLYDSSGFDPNYPCVFEFIMYSDEISETYFVQYEKLMVVIGQLGGFANILIVLGTLFSKFEHNLRFRNYLINELYSFSKTKKNKKKEKNKTFNEVRTEIIPLELFESKKFQNCNKKEETPETKNFLFSNEVKNDTIPFEMSENEKIGTVNNKSGNIDNKKENPINIITLAEVKPEIIPSHIDESKKMRILDEESIKMGESVPSIMKKHHKNFEEYRKNKQSNHSIKMNYFNYMLMKIKPNCKLKEKEKLYLKGIKNIDREMDITEILRKLHDIDKLKAILLNDSQLCLFNFLSKPIIYDSKSDNL